MRRLLPIALGVSLAVAAVAFAALAVQTWRYPGHAAAHDRSLARQPVAATVWADHGGIAEAVLGAADDATFRRALTLFLRSRPDEPGAGKSGEQVLAGLEAAIALAAAVHGDPPPARRALAANLAGILTGEDAVFEPEGAPRVERAAELFRQAIRVQPSSTAAKANLELLFNYAGPTGIGDESTGGFGGFGKEGGAGDAGGGY
jgi:hypothetical protein